MTKPQITYNLFEYGSPASYKGDVNSLDSLDVFLDDIWNKREHSNLAFWGAEESLSNSQRFIDISRKTGSLSLKSNKYVGVIKYKNTIINLLPKIFSDKKNEPSKDEVKAIQSHILWWLSYCRKLKFPMSLSSFNQQKSNFFEVLIYLFSSYTKEVLSNMIYQTYQDVENELPYMRGRVDFNKYASNNYPNGNQHILPCRYDSFEIDNGFNRIVKFVTKLLIVFTQEADNKKNLREILFALDEVKDVQSTIYDCEKVNVNPLFSNMNIILDYCKLFLSNSTVMSYKDKFEVFAFLLPMEYVFEDFILGFIMKEMKGVVVSAQDKSKYLTENKAFQLRPDLVFYINGKKIIADTKYKMIYPHNPNDKKFGISQSDMYQMLAYAVRNKSKEIKLFYPSTIDTLKQENNISYKIIDELAEMQSIAIDAFQLPIIKSNWKEVDKRTVNLAQSFDELRQELKTSLNKILLDTIHVIKE
ncbi:MAG: hypothetical protein DRI86_11890 [Bacteroidetes bacterium]|nr:MAG: hypothetical protein DRI86_11890 [Bacteroidota bacterium]